MPITSPEDYAQAKEYAASGKASPKLLASMKAYETQRDNDPHLSEQTSQQSLESARGTPVEVPKPGTNGFWKPQRPLGAMDYVPQDTGGNLAIWRDMPVEVYRRKVFEPQRAAAIAAGQKAMVDFQRYGANAFSPEDQMRRTLAIAQGQAAATQDPSKIDENDPAYKQFNDQQWQQAVQQRQQDPNAGPIQRLEKMRGQPGLASTMFYGAEKAKDLALSGARGALDMATLGLGTGALDAATEALSGREAVDVGRGDQEAHPWASGIGGAGMALLRPTLGTAGIATKIFGKAAPVLGRYAGAALSGATSTAAEGLGRDVSTEGADALSGSPSAVLDRGRLEPERLATNTAIRAGGGALAGAGGQLVSDAGRGIANKISESAIKGTQGRSPYETAEAAGYQFDPVLGIRVPTSIKAQQAATRETGTSWAERYADRAGPAVSQNVDKFAVGEKADMAKQNLAYFNSVGSEVTPVSNMNQALEEVTKELRKVNPSLVGRLKDFVYSIDPLLTPRDMGKAVERVSNEANKAAAGSDSQAAEAFKRLQAGLMEDMQNLPKGNLPEGWPALRTQHEARGAAIDEARQLTGARNPGQTLPDDVAELNRNLMNQGKKSVSVKQEAALDRFMPPDLKRETLMLRAANMVEGIGGDQVGPYPSRAGVIKWAEGKLVPRAYGLGRALSRPPDNFPISDKMFAFMNSRIPRATMFMPGMDLTKMVQERLAMDGRPKTFKDLSPEQQQMLLELVSPEQKELLQEPTP